MTRAFATALQELTLEQTGESSAACDWSLAWARPCMPALHTLDVRKRRAWAPGACTSLRAAWCRAPRLRQLGAILAARSDWHLQRQGLLGEALPTTGVPPALQSLSLWLIDCPSVCLEDRFSRL